MLSFGSSCKIAELIIQCKYCETATKLVPRVGDGETVGDCDCRPVSPSLHFDVLDEDLSSDSRAVAEAASRVCSVQINSCGIRISSCIHKCSRICLETPVQICDRSNSPSSLF